VAAGIQDIVSGYLIEGYTTEAGVYDFGPVAMFWLAASVIAFVLPVLNWKKMKPRKE
jgi:OPA family sugar phosphate sensor protein UhpC-like MFS transporter